jgi:electron transfer flavoprotein-quinone oxidoreductase
VADHVHDCIVAGAGPAGAAAALQLARDGLDVVLLERGSRPGEKNVMSGVLLTQKLHALIPDFAERAPLQRRITGGYEAYILGDDEVLALPGLRSYRADRYPHPPFTVFRSQFDAWFAQEAESAGAELFTDTLVEDLLWEGGQVVGVSTRRGDLRAKVVIGADGVNSTVAEKSGLGVPSSPDTLSLIARQVLDLPAERIEERFALLPGEGLISLYYGVVTGPTGNKGLYYSELYTNLDSLSLTVEVRLNVLQACGVPVYDVMVMREAHPYIARLIEGAKVREYQAHLIPWGGVGDLECLYGDGVLLAGDAGRFSTKDGVGSWPAMASGAAAASAVKHACERGDLSRATLAVYLECLDQEGLVDTQREARQDWDSDPWYSTILQRYPERVFELAGRFFDEWVLGPADHTTSVYGQLYDDLIRPLAPWYVRWPLGAAAWLDTRRWRRKRTRE